MWRKHRQICFAFACSGDASWPLVQPPSIRQCRCRWHIYGPSYSIIVWAVVKDVIVTGSWNRRRRLAASEASCHWGTWGVCLPPDGVASLVNSLQNRVKSITLCVTLNANTGKIAPVTLCIQIEWLFYTAFWCETVTQKWRWLHPGTGARAHTFTNDWARGTDNKNNKKTRKWSNCTGHTEALTKTTDCRPTCKAKKNFRRFAPDMCLPLLNSSQRRWIGLHRHHLIIID